MTRKVYTINPKTTAKITKQRLIASKSTKELRQNHKNYSVIQKQTEKKKKGTKNK